MQLVEQIAAIMLKVTGYVMSARPARDLRRPGRHVTTQGLGVLVTYAKFIGGFYLGSPCSGRC